ncbi:bifunctional peptidase and (3S)-lysyl hydroxylase JMJD7-like [Clytia hemisphaerica]|uniref:bifunctional peptidase and (3S)-lysyl hydroxylase JMJD7-like n=1 Tax=Clytia hemisphaerica TaxID=252671 RepID=UPI0034D4022D
MILPMFLLLCGHHLMGVVSTELKEYTLQEVCAKITRYHFLLGTDESVRTLLESISWLYRNETELVVGMYRKEFTDGGMPWKEQKYSNRDASIAFFKQRKIDRKCLIQADFRKAVKAESVLYKSVDELVQFLNEQCFYFVTLADVLNRAGMERKSILKDLYHVPGPDPNRKIVKCERIQVPRNSAEFARNFLFRSKPVIIEGAIDHWDALSKWSNDFLREKYQDKKVHVKLTPNGEFEGCDLAQKFDNYDTFSIPKNVKEQLPYPDLVVVRPAVGSMKFGEFMDLVEGKNNPNNMSAYLEYSSIREYFPELEYDLDQMPFAPDLLKLSHLNIWISNGRTLGKLHFDPFDNFLCQLRGNKRLTIFEPHRNYDLYEAHIQEAMLGYNPKSGKFRNHELLDSTSMVMSPIDILKPDFDRFSNFTRAKPMECHLNEGDVLFLPAFWWHEVQSYPNAVEQRNLAVNFWYKPFLTKEFPCVDCKLDVNHVYRELLEKFAT